MLRKLKRRPSALGGDMEIHKPKLARNWREFAVEIGTIICGILIALGLEQTVRWLERRAEVAEAREALRTEIARNAHIALYSIEEERCFTGYWDKAAMWVNGGPRPQIKLTGGINTLVGSTWDVVKVGAVSHMPLKERLAYSSFYDAVAGQTYMVERERDVSVRLFGLMGRATLTSADVQGALDEVAQVRLLAGLHSGSSTFIVKSAKALGIDPAPLTEDERDHLARVCAEAGVAPAPSST
jgi:hypothetical protein